MPSAGAIPIPDQNIRSEIEKFSISNFSVDVAEYLKTYKQWILSSKHNRIIGLENFKSASFIHGTIQAFDHFYFKHKHRKFKFFRGEFMYHRASIKNKSNWSYLDEEELSENDAFIVSVPFSDTGKQRQEINDIFKKCDQLKIPVMIDLAYLPIARNIKLDLNFDCIETVCTSISKAFDGAQFIRAGIRFQRENTDDGIDIYNSVNMVPTYNMSVACHLMNNYSIDYNWETYKNSYEDLCKELNLNQTDCVIFGTSNTEYTEFNRGNSWNRVCISTDLREKYDSSKSQ